MRITSVLGLGLAAAALLAATPMVGAPANAATVAQSSAVATADTATPVMPTLAGRLAAVKTARQINYYPAEAGWTRMWTTFDADAIVADLAKAQSLGADSVRAIVFPSVFGYPAPKAEYTTKLAQFVSLAAAHGMTVKLTLFDWWDGYADVTGSSAWATAILAPYRYDNRIIAIGLQNEVDPDNAAAIAWAKNSFPSYGPRPRPFR